MWERFPVPMTWPMRVRCPLILVVESPSSVPIRGLLSPAATRDSTSFSRSDRSRVNRGGATCAYMVGQDSTPVATASNASDIAALSPTGLKRRTRSAPGVPQREDDGSRIRPEMSTHDGQFTSTGMVAEYFFDLVRLMSEHDVPCAALTQRFPQGESELLR